jgi:uncharacterized membrane protein YuzA (DUF378 family)
MRTIEIAAAALLVIAGLNCGLIALFQYDMIATVFGAAIGPVVLSRLFFGLVGVAALYQVAGLVYPTKAAAH